jgi:signal transduction histidine kinase
VSLLVTVLVISVDIWKDLTIFDAFIATIALFTSSLSAFLVFERVKLKQKVKSILEALDIDIRNNEISLSNDLAVIKQELYKRSDVIDLNIVKTNITSKEDLSKNLEKIASKCFKLLDAESAELALFDKSSGIYHSSFVMGKPFQSGSQAMLSESSETGDTVESPEEGILVEQILFSGQTLGTLRISLKKKKASEADKRILKLLALQSGISIINAEYTTQLMRMKELSRDSVREKTGFLANLSHEIRAPLGILINGIELILEGLCGEINEEQRETLQIIKSNSDHLLDLMNDVLDYAKTESGKIILNKELIQLNQLMIEIVKIVKTQAQTKDHKVLFNTFNEDLYIQCDKRHLRQVLINVVTNAIKYTPNNGIIEIWLDRINGKQARINVKDNGVGISHKDKYKVFEPFIRIDNPYSSRQSGAGIGMSLTKNLVEANGGNIGFDSVSGVGTHFWITFDLFRKTASTEIKIIPDVLIYKPNGNSILYIAQADTERSMVDKYLKEKGFNTILSSSLEDSLQTLREGKIDIILLDSEILNLPLDDNIKAFKDNAKNPLIPFLLLSNNAFTYDIEKFIKAGVDRCLTKPIPLKELAYIIHTLSVSKD